MKDAYSFHATREPRSTKPTTTMYDAYKPHLHPLRHPVRRRRSRSRPHRRQRQPRVHGRLRRRRRHIVTSDKGNYAANVEKAEIGNRNHTFGGEPTGALEKVHTPNLPGIDEVGKFMKVKPKNMLKTLVFKTADPSRRDSPGEPRQSQMGRRRRPRRSRRQRSQARSAPRRPSSTSTKSN